MPNQCRILFALCCAAALAVAAGGARGLDFPHTEARLTHPVGLTPDGTRLLALDPPGGRLSVFDITRTDAGEPRLIAEIPVGVEPVSLRARTDDEVWVVNELGDSVSIVSLTRRVTVATLSAPDEPADVVFAAGKAFVSCARSNAVRVFDASTRQLLATVALNGDFPRALAASADGTEVYAAFQLSGNATTSLPAALAPNPPAPTNTSLPPAPRTALIVPAGSPGITWTVLDNDVAVISTATHAVTRMISGAGTNLFDIAVQPGTGQLWVPNTEARNLVRFEPALRGHLVDHRLSRIVPGTGAVTIHDLHPGADYAQLPNPALQNTALAQPTNAIFSPSGAELWVAAFGSDRLARVNASTGAVMARTDLRTGPEAMRGPRGLALDAVRGRLYVLNKISRTISIIHADTGALLGEVPVSACNVMDSGAQAGRSFLYDTRLSGNGLSSCAVCHIDGDRDGIAWDLGNPGGSLLTVIGANLAAHDPTPRPREMHPMKGPMITQTLRGLQRGQLLHWRGDRATLSDFNGTFPALLAGPLLTEAQLIAFDTYIHSLKHHPNPNRTLADLLPASFNGGNPARGRSLFNNHLNHCAVCHTGASGTDNNVDAMTLVGSPDHVKTPPLSTTYQRTRFNNAPGAQSISGFGLGHDGTLAARFLPHAHPYDLDTLATQADFADVTAFVLCFDTGTPPAVGHTLTVTPQNAGTVAAMLDAKEEQVSLGACDLVVQGRLDGASRTFFFDAGEGNYRTDSAAVPTISREELLAALAGEDVLHFTGLFAATASTRSTDRNANSIPDLEERPPTLIISQPGGLITLHWPGVSPEWYLETSFSLQPPWTPAPVSITRGPSSSTAAHLDPLPRAFFKLRRTTW